MRCLMCGSLMDQGTFRDIFDGSDPLCQTCRQEWQRRKIRFCLDGVKAERLGILLGLLSDCAVCTGRSENRDELIAAFRQGKYNVLVCTTVMERGMTIPGVQVCVFEADSRIFDEASLVQMAGRAGRTLNHPDGDVLFLCRHRSGKAEQCAVSLQEANACAA